MSFLGVSFNAGEKVARVRITSGNTAPGPSDDPASNVDVVAMDDFIYGEPQSLQPDAPTTRIPFAWAGGSRFSHVPAPFMTLPAQRAPWGSRRTRSVQLLQHEQPEL
jgi:hypothetical protein